MRDVLREKDKGRHLPLCGPEDTVGASPDHNDSLHLIHLGLHQASLNGLEDPVFYLVVTRNLQSVRHHLQINTCPRKAQNGGRKEMN